MTVAYWCVFAAGFLPYLASVIAKIGGDRFNNASPRDWLEAQSGFRKRANAAQLNGFEAFPLFAAAVIIAHLAGAPQERIDLLAIAFVVVRLIYIGFYVANLPALRSLAWFAALGCVIALFFSAA